MKTSYISQKREFLMNFPLNLANFVKKNIKAKKSKKRIDLNFNVFSFSKKLKFSKNLIGLVIFAVFFQSVLFFTPILAIQADGEFDLTKNNKVEFTNGAVLSDLEQELLQRGHVIVENAISVIVDDEGKVMTKVQTLDGTPVSFLAEPDPADFKGLPATKDVTFVDWGVRTLTSYNSEAGQTDDSPCITANMFNVCEYGIEDTIAANFLKFGTKVRIPDLFGDRIFIVRDRMNKRYPNRVDVWMLDKNDSKQFGVKRAQIEVIVEE